MSKLYIPLLALVLAGSATAQHNTNVRPLAKKTRFEQLSSPDRPLVNAANREILWSDDFSNPSTWVASSEIPDGSTQVDSDTWVIGTAIPAGSFPIGAITSTTAANGYALFDSDLYCGGYQNATLAMAGDFDLSGYPGVLFQFEQFYRQFRGQCFVEVSTDGGTTWTSFEVNDDIDVNSSTTNPNLKVVNISSAAGGYPSVKVRFRNFSTIDAHGVQGGCDYAWMVDDAAFTTLPDNEIVLNWGYTSTTGQGEEYGRVPQDQFGNSLNVGAEVFNFGGMNQTNIVVNLDLTNTSPVDMPVPDLISQASHVTDFDILYSTPPAIGEYTATFTVTSDQIALDGNLDDNSSVRNFEVTDGIYSLDKIGGHVAGLEALQRNGTGTFADNTENVKLMTMYSIRTPYSLTGLEIQLANGSTVGGRIVVSILDTADVLNEPDNIVNQPVNDLESAPYFLTAADIASGTVTIPFRHDGSATMLPVGGYYACVSLSQEGTGEVYVLDDITIPQPAFSSVLWLPFDPDGFFMYGGNGTAYAIRLTNAPLSGVGVAENTTLEGITMFPNPTNGILRINATSSEKMTVEVMNVLGKQVLTNVFNGNTVLDLGGLADGVYNVRVSNGTQSTVQRITLN